MGRPPKPKLTRMEFALVAQVLNQPRQARGSSLDAAARAVSIHRGADLALDPRTRSLRQVSGRWVGDQLRLLGFAGKTGLREKLAQPPENSQAGGNSVAVCGTGSPMTKIATSTNGQPIVNAPPTQDAAPFSNEVKNERPEVKA